MNAEGELREDSAAAVGGRTYLPALSRAPTQETAGRYDPAVDDWHDTACIVWFANTLAERAHGSRGLSRSVR